MEFQGENTMSDISKMTINLLLLGRTQSGKSAAGNTLLGSTDFASCLSPCSVTTSCRLGCSCNMSDFGRRQGRALTVQVRVLDTPGYPHSSLSKEQIQREVKDALAQHFGEKGLHLALLVLRADVVLCEEEEASTIQWIQELLGPNWKTYTVILFTHADQIEESPFTIEKYLLSASDTLRKVMQSVQQKCIFIDNHARILKHENLKALRKIMEVLKQNNYQTLQVK
ncbi:GTPase IMAP family member GIMD1 [Python bivittatus]|uniref:GTPase IMAP family member GIMD1 n=1 Tax=Python bivittatus TaxID=176946 RepID=A0A9F2WFZ7_PYTBI|nr:GTPase IMAP family member GIMD1 [Python bivittatus]